MKLKYIGESFGAVSLTNGEIYECIGIEEFPDGFDLRIIDDSGEDYIYDPINPAPFDMSSKGGRWEIIEDPDGKLAELFKKLKIS